MKIGKTKLEVICSDATKVNADCIVNPANDMLWLGGGVSALIRKSGGVEIETEALTQAPAEIGVAIVTGAGSLDARYIIHAVISGQDLEAHETDLRKAVKASLAAAESRKCTSLAFPMLVSETAHVEIHIAARIIVEETVNFLVEGKKSFTQVIFADKNRNICDIINETLMDIFTKHG